MRKAINLALVLAALSIPVFVSSLASATDQKQALALCEKRGPDCTSGLPNGNGDVTFCVKNSGKSQCVWCPSQGDCAVAMQGHPRRGTHYMVSGILSAKAPVTTGPVSHPADSRAAPNDKASVHP